MDHQERTVYEYLKNWGYEDVVFEPDGNIPPDFLVNGKIAIEVRRLNQHSKNNGRYRGLEEDGRPFLQAVYSVFPEFNTKFSGKTYYIFVRYRRPLPNAKKAKELTRKVLQGFYENRTDTTLEVDISKNITFVILPATPKEGILFLIGGNSDSERGGFLLEEMESNIILCSEEKAKKVSKYRNKYPVWWLVLVDHIGDGLDEFNQKFVHNRISVSHKWDKLLIINPNKPMPAIEV